MPATSRPINGVHTGGEPAFASSLGNLLAKAVASPFGVVGIAVGCSAMVGWMMSARRPVAPPPPQTTAGDENLARSLRTMEKLVDKFPAPAAPHDQQQIVKLLRRQNELLRNKNESLKNALADREAQRRKLRELERQVAALERSLNSTNAPSQSASPGTARTGMDVDGDSTERRTSAGEPVTPVPRSYRYSRMPTRGYVSGSARYANLSETGEAGARIREAARQRQAAEAAAKAARRRAAVEVGRRHHRRSAFNRVFDQR